MAKIISFFNIREVFWSCKHELSRSLHSNEITLLNRQIMYSRLMIFKTTTQLLENTNISLSLALCV